MLKLQNRNRRDTESMPGYMISLLSAESEQTESIQKIVCSKTTDKTLKFFEKGNIFFWFWMLNYSNYSQDKSSFKPKPKVIGLALR